MNRSTGDEPTGGAESAARLSELRWALAGGVFTTAAVFGITALVGQVSSFEARRLVAGIKPTATFAASTYIAAGATILALMSTVISFSITHDSEFRQSHYRRLRRVAMATTTLILVAIALLTCLVVPIDEAGTSPTGYIVLYWAVLVLSSLGGGLTVTIVLMLNYAVRGLVDLGTHGRSFLTVHDTDPDTDPNTEQNTGDALADGTNIDSTTGPADGTNTSANTDPDTDPAERTNTGTNTDPADSTNTGTNTDPAGHLAER